jgi:hypothetical protein
MRKLSNILILSVIYLVFCGKSCENDTERTAWQEQEVSAARDSIVNEFDAEFLTEEARYASEAKAIQDLNDFADYVEIFSDRNKDTLFRAKAKEMISGMFGSQGNEVSLGRIKKDKIQWSRLEVFLDKGFGDYVLRVNLEFDSIIVKQPLVKLNDSTYTGVLSARQILALYQGVDRLTQYKARVNIDFSSVKKYKVFGKDTIQTWEVRLGDMRE